MGSSISQNINDTIVNTMSEVSTDIIQNSVITQNSSQIISIEDIDGNVHIDGNILTQKANINMKTLMNTLLEEESQQKLAHNLSQKAKSMVSDLNLAQLSITSNRINSILTATLKIVHNINQTCENLSNQTQQITIKRASGDVYIQNNVLSQMTDIFQSCINDAISSNKIIQDVATEIKQESTSKTSGISIVSLGVLGLLGLYGLPLTGLVGGVILLNFLGPGLIIIGFMMIVYYQLNKIAEISHIAYSNNIFDCNNTELIYNSNVSTYDQLSKKCLDDKQCAGFDWKEVKINNMGKYESQKPEYKLYSNIDESCLQSLETDKGSILNTSDLFIGYENPNENPDNINTTSKKHDIYINLTDSIWYKKEDFRWISQKKILKNNYNNLSILAGINKPGVFINKNSIYIHYNKNNPMYFYVYKYSSKWDLIYKVNGPGYISDSNKFNITGIKTFREDKMFLILGIVLIIIGLILIVIKNNNDKDNDINKDI